MGNISADAFRRLYLLYLVSAFSKGVYGFIRAQKVTYLSERELDLHPFEFKRHYYGQYSDSLTDIEKQLISMDYLDAMPLDTSLVVEFEGQEIPVGGSRLTLRSQKQGAHYREIFRRAAPAASQAIDRAVDKYGYMQQAELLRVCYDLPEMQSAAMGQVLIPADLPDSVEVQLSDDDCEDLELSLRPEMIIAMTALAEAVEKTDLDLDQVRVLELHTSSS